MADEVKLIATKEIPSGFKTRIASEEGYKTRRLKAGDEFYAHAPLGKFLVDTLKRAEYQREKANVPAPPRALVQKVVEAAPPVKEAPKPVGAVSTRSVTVSKAEVEAANRKADKNPRGAPEPMNKPKSTTRKRQTARKSTAKKG